MSSASLTDIKKELGGKTYKELYDIILRMAKFKKDNKELLNYLLMDSMDESGYVEKVKEIISAEFVVVNWNSLRTAKKVLRKILANTNKYIKYSGQKQTEVDLLIHFCDEFLNFEVYLLYSPMLNNIYERQIGKIQKAVASLHEDLQYDYAENIKALELNLLKFKNYYR